MHHLVFVEEPVVEDVRVELNLVARDGVYEGHDNFEEGIHEEGNVDDKRQSEPLRVVRLEDVKHLKN